MANKISVNNYPVYSKEQVKEIIRQWRGFSHHRNGEYDIPITDPELSHLICRKNTFAYSFKYLGVKYDVLMVTVYVSRKFYVRRTLYANGVKRPLSVLTAVNPIHREMQGEPLKVKENLDGTPEMYKRLNTPPVLISYEIISGEKPS
jgi:hypothetical protein